MRKCLDCPASLEDAHGLRKRCLDCAQRAADRVRNGARTRYRKAQRERRWAFPWIPA